MNFVKKNFSVVMNLISVLFVIISIGSITSYGLSEGRNTFSKTISFSSKQGYLISIFSSSSNMTLPFTMLFCYYM